MLLGYLADPELLSVLNGCCCSKAILVGRKPSKGGEVILSKKISSDKSIMKKTESKGGRSSSYLNYRATSFAAKGVLNV